VRWRQPGVARRQLEQQREELPLGNRNNNDPGNRNNNAGFRSQHTTRQERPESGRSGTTGQMPWLCPDV